VGDGHAEAGARSDDDRGLACGHGAAFLSLR
jgi:hypothetical protein